MASVVIEGIDEHPVPGNLKAHFCGNTLLLPKGVVDVLRKDGVRTAEDLMSYIQAFPSGMADSLRWSISDVNNAAVKLRKELRAHIADEHLDPQSRPNPPLGARNPDDLP